MKFVSTRNPSVRVTFEEALFQGLAPDGGLYIPETDLDLKTHFQALGKDSSFHEIAALVTAYLLKGELDAAAVHRIVKNAFPFEPKLVMVDDQLSILELYHGPSCAFKDFGASFLASAMEEFLQHSNRKAVIGGCQRIRTLQVYPVSMLPFTKTGAVEWKSPLINQRGDAAL